MISLENDNLVLIKWGDKANLVLVCTDFNHKNIKSK